MEKPISGFEAYTISEDGTVKNTITDKRKIPTSNKAGKGYEYVDLYSKGIHGRKYIHRLVATAFIPNPEGKPYGTHPCAYVKLKENDTFYNQADYDKIPIDCHGGLTYCAHNGFGKNTEYYKQGHWIGWDYAHWGDYTGYDLICDESMHKYFTSEILYDVKNVIRQLKDYK